MERRDFVNNIGQLTAFACAGGLLVACSKSSSSPSGGGGGNGQPLITANLDTQLTAIGSSIIKNDVIVIRVGPGDTTGDFHALGLICTHQGCTVNWNGGQDKFQCPCHGSEYDSSGNVIQGPAPRALKKYTVSIEGSTLTVT